MLLDVAPSNRPLLLNLDLELLLVLLCDRLLFLGGFRRGHAPGDTGGGE